MSVSAGFAIYFIIWWVVLFTVLPVGIRSQAETGDIIPGSAPSAPTSFSMVRKAIWTTIISALVFGSFLFVYETGLIGLDDIPFLPRFEH
jgi:predicted secreted protein